MNVASSRLQSLDSPQVCAVPKSKKKVAKPSAVVPDPQVVAASPVRVSEPIVDVWLRALRWKQWVKNVLIFLPLFFSHQWGQPGLVWRAILGFAVFCAGASGIYLVNDLMDEAADREHPTKRHRPLAAGRISRSHCWIMSVVLVVGGAAFATILSPDFLVMYGVYVVSACAYSLWLKRLMLVDAMMLAGFYTLRIFAGSLATQTPVSNWLLLFSLFFFLGLAFQKRFAELLGWDDSQEPLRRRGYVKADLGLINSMGTSSSYMAVLVLALYVQSPEVATHYGRPGALWWTVPCLLLWVSRLWLLAGRGEVTEDAIAFAVRDRVSYAIAAAVLVIATLAQPV